MVLHEDGDGEAAGGSDDDSSSSSSSSSSSTSSSLSSSTSIESNRQEPSVDDEALFFYEQLGAPASLLLRQSRNDEDAVLNEPPNPPGADPTHRNSKPPWQVAEELCDDLQRQYRLQCRWYLPCNQHVIMPKLPPPEFAPIPVRHNQHYHRTLAKNKMWKKQQQNSKSNLRLRYACHVDGSRVDWDAVREQNSFKLQHLARQTMLLHPSEVVGADDGQIEDRSGVIIDPFQKGKKRMRRKKKKEEEEGDGDGGNAEKINDDEDGGGDGEDLSSSVFVVEEGEKPSRPKKKKVELAANLKELKRRERTLRSYQCLDANYVQICRDGKCQLDEDKDDGDSRKGEAEKDDAAPERGREGTGGRNPPRVSAAAASVASGGKSSTTASTRNEHRCASLGLTRLYDAERRNRADPAYNAPFSIRTVKLGCRHDYLESELHDRKNIRDRHDRKRREPLTSSSDDSPAARYGNCLLSVPCPCRWCSGIRSRHSRKSAGGNGQDSPPSSWYLMYPEGTLMDTVRLQRLVFPRDRGRSPSSGTALPPQSQQPKERDGNAISLNVGDGIRQLAQCGTNTFVVRTTLYCTVFQMNASGDSEVLGEVEGCVGVKSLTALRRFDWRTFSIRRRHERPSFRPVDVTVHPKYASAWTDPKVAVLVDSDQRKDECNVRHLQFSAQETRVTQHHISNIQRMSKIEFDAHHPMVLWTAARPYVRPALAANHLNRYPRIGHGYSLFSVDLRTNQAAFQWSPSHEDYMIEGVHSLSGIGVDWINPHRLWVSSISAGRTWELDARMPCRAVTSWSLPHTCDDTGATLPVTGLYGAGTLFAQPSVVDKHSIKRDPGRFPVLSVGFSPGTFGIHLYQRPIVQPRFQTQSLECAACPGLGFMKEMSVAPSSVFALPDVSSDKVFTCGLAPIYVPVSRYLSHEEVQHFGYLQDNAINSVLCTITMTNVGDLYAHSLLETGAGHRPSRNYADLVVGSCPALPVEEDTSTKPPSDTRLFDHKNELEIKLVNNYPPLASTIVPLPPPGPLATSNIPVFPNSRKGRGDGCDQCVNGNEESSAEEEEMHTLRPRPTALTRRLEADGCTDENGTVRLPSRLVAEATGRHEDVLDWYDHLALEGRVEDSEQSRSDLTSEFLEKISNAFPKNHNS